MVITEPDDNGVEYVVVTLLPLLSREDRNTLYFRDRRQRWAWPVVVPRGG